ncbi:MAG: hypothetical protein R3C59_20785 [Planctomycetaceae bacterium]
MPHTTKLSPPESLWVGILFLAKLILPPVILWGALFAVRSGFSFASGTRYEISDNLLVYAIAVDSLIIASFGLYLFLFIRLPDGRCFIEWESKKPSFKPTDNSPTRDSIDVLAALVGILLLIVGPIILGGIATYGGTRYDAVFLTSLVVVMIDHPVAICAIKSSLLFDAERQKYIARRNARRDALLKARKEAEELRRKQALIVPPKPPVTFESRLNDITAEHQERMRQLERLQIDPQEREYLIELQQARYLEQVRTLTDPSLGRPNDAGFSSDLGE